MKHKRFHWSKEDEIEFLDEIIREMENNSYLGPFLKRHRNQIVFCIRNDFEVEVRSDPEPPPGHES